MNSEDDSMESDEEKEPWVEDVSEEEAEVLDDVPRSKKGGNKKRKKKKRLRSRNEYIDDGLENEDGDDAYADLEGFIEDI